MNSTDEALAALRMDLLNIEMLIAKLTDKYLSTEMPAKSFMTRQTPLLMQRSVLVAKLKAISAPAAATEPLSRTPTGQEDSSVTTANQIGISMGHDTKPDNSTD